MSVQEDQLLDVEDPEPVEEYGAILHAPHLHTMSWIVYIFSHIKKGVFLPSMRTLSASLSTLSVEMRTRIQKMNVQMGSTIVHVG